MRVTQSIALVGELGDARSLLSKRCSLGSEHCFALGERALEGCDAPLRNGIHWRAHS
jgi:hypothetical protein